MSEVPVAELRDAGFQLEFCSHAFAILQVDFPQALSELTECLLEFEIPISELIGSGGGEAKGTQRLRRALTDLGWPKREFVIEKTIDGVAKESISHEVDHVKPFGRVGQIALEIEWNNKDPFFDRDLENFKRLHAEGAISVGVIITRGAELQSDIPKYVERFIKQKDVKALTEMAEFGYSPTARQRKDISELALRGGGTGEALQGAISKVFCRDKFGSATTHWSKLEDRVRRGVGNPCPLLLIGLPSAIVKF